MTVPGRTGGWGERRQNRFLLIILVVTWPFKIIKQMFVIDWGTTFVSINYVHFRFFCFLKTYLESDPRLTAPE